MKKGFFITGIDTGVGKTWATIALMHYFKQQGETVVGMKPVAAGCEWLDGQLKNEDALLIQEHNSLSLDYKAINPYAFEQPVSPHLAALENTVNIDVIVHAFNQLQDKADVLLVEGAGGWLSPISNKYDIADLAKKLQLPVLLVVAVKLGCINQARLTYQAIQASGVECRGWIAICTDPEMLMKNENIEMIRNKISVPLLGVLPYSAKMDFNYLAKYILGPL